MFTSKTALKQNTLNFTKTQKRFLNKSYRPTMYNLRLYYSNLRRNEQSYGKWDMTYGPEGFEKTRTDRNPDNFKYKSNLFNHTLYEMRHLYGDLVYQMVLRRHRLNDSFNKYVLPTALVGFYLLSAQHMFFMVRF